MAIKEEALQITAARSRDKDREISRPVRKTARPFFWLAATYWERAVWMEPAQRAKQMPNTG